MEFDFVYHGGLDDAQSQGESIFEWRSTSDFVPTTATSYGNMTIGEEMSMEFDFVYHGGLDDDGKGVSFFRVGASTSVGGASCNGQLNYYPALFIDSDEPYFDIRVSEKGTCARSYVLQDFGYINTNISYHVEIHWNSTNLSITINDGDEMWNYFSSRAANRDNDIGDVVPVWFNSDKYSGDFEVGDGTFSNIIITSYLDTNVPTVDPTNDPTTDPTTISPTSDPTTSSPTINPSSNPTDSPTMRPTTYAPTGGEGEAEDIVIVEETDTTEVTEEASFEESSGLETELLYWAALGAGGVLVLCCFMTLSYVVCKRMRRKKVRDTPEEPKTPDIAPHLFTDSNMASDISPGSLNLKDHQSWNHDQVASWVGSVARDHHCEVNEYQIAESLKRSNISGLEMENWNHSTLESMGIDDPSIRNNILGQIERYRPQQSESVVSIDESPMNQNNIMPNLMIPNGNGHLLQAGDGPQQVIQNDGGDTPGDDMYGPGDFEIEPNSYTPY